MKKIVLLMALLALPFAVNAAPSQTMYQQEHAMLDGGGGGGGMMVSTEQPSLPSGGLQVSVCGANEAWSTQLKACISQIATEPVNKCAGITCGTGQTCVDGCCQF